MKDVLQRGCGWRKAGAIYVTIPPTMEFKPPYDKLPIDCYLFCPGWEVDLTELGLSAQGMRILERRDAFGNGTGIWDLWDFVGSEKGYPWVPDFVEEARIMGTSRLCPQPVIKSDEFKKLDPTVSQHIFVSNRGLLNDESAEILHNNRYFNPNNPTELASPCPIGNKLHDEFPNQFFQPCTGMLWECVENTKERQAHIVRMPRDVKPPTFVYDAVSAAKEWKIGFKAAAFMALPLNITLEVITDTLDKKHEKAIQMLLDLDIKFPWVEMPK
jgi:hypothetical protein